MRSARFFIALIMLAAVRDAHAQGGPSSPPQPQPVQWQRVFSSDGAFSFSMPGAAKFSSTVLKAKNGHPVRFSSFTVDRGTRAYMASFSDYDNQTRISLEGAIDGVLGEWKNVRNLKREHVTLYDRPGMIADFDSGPHSVVVHVFTDGQRLYQLGYVAITKEFSWESANGFFDSFQFEN